MQWQHLFLEKRSNLQYFSAASEICPSLSLVEINLRKRKLTIRCRGISQRKVYSHIHFCRFGIWIYGQVPMLLCQKKWCKAIAFSFKLWMIWKHQTLSSYVLLKTYFNTFNMCNTQCGLSISTLQTQIHQSFKSMSVKHWKSSR